jgi:hypothetical protein
METNLTRRSFLGRAGDVGDELGSKIVAARIVRELVRLSFLMERATFRTANGLAVHSIS